MALLASAYVGGAFLYSGPVAAALTPPAEKRVTASSLAPADEYFGTARMSVLEIANRLRDLASAYDVRARSASSTLAAAQLTVDALRDWERRYPADRWLPRSLFALERVYARLPAAEARNRLWQTDHWLVQAYPASPEAAFCRREIAAHRVLDPPGRGEIFAVTDPRQSGPPQVAVGAAVPTATPRLPVAWRKLVLPLSGPSPAVHKPKAGGAATKRAKPVEAPTPPGGDVPRF
jgi:hypothetical protein